MARKPPCWCEARWNADIHSRHHIDYHPYADARPAGIAPVSDARKEFLKTSGYTERTREIREQGLPCAIQSPVCTGVAEHQHEPLSRGRAGGLEAALRDGPPPVPACDRCNDYVSQHPAWARARGFLVSLKGQHGDGQV